MMAAQYTAQELKTGLSLAVIANVIWGVAALYWVETAPRASSGRGRAPGNLEPTGRGGSPDLGGPTAGDLAAGQGAKPAGLECAGDGAG